MMKKTLIKTIEYDSKEMDTVTLTYTQIVSTGTRANFKKKLDKMAYYRMKEEGTLLNYLEE